MEVRTMFNTINEGDTVTNIQVKGVNAPEAARFLLDVEEKAAARINQVVFARLGGDWNLEYAMAVEYSNLNGCYNVHIWYRLNGRPEKIVLETIEADHMHDSHRLLQALCDDIAAKISFDLMQRFVAKNSIKRLA